VEDLNGGKFELFLNCPVFKHNRSHSLPYDGSYFQIGLEFRNQVARNANRLG